MVRETAGRRESDEDQEEFKDERGAQRGTREDRNNWTERSPGAGCVYAGRNRMSFVRMIGSVRYGVGEMGRGREKCSRLVALRTVAS